MPIVDILEVFKWWLVLFIIGIIATPLSAYFFPRLPDKGYAFTKLLGLLISSYIFWILGSLGFLTNDLGSIIFSCVLLLAASISVYAKSIGNIKHWVMCRWQYLLFVEILFAALFIFWAWVRAQNPAIVATEKPMEFAFLNAIGRSSTFPPHDPWLSDFAISYYYFGYIMTSVLARLAATPEFIAFNLAVAWLAAGTSLSVFGLLYNLINANYTNLLNTSRRGWLGSILTPIVGAIAVPIVGNLETLLEILHSNSIGNVQFWSWLDIRDLNVLPISDGFGQFGPRYWWWWRSSRVIHEYYLSGMPELALEPITEFPSFSFILGDLHPHVLSLPFAILALGLALHWWLSPSAIAETEWLACGWQERLILVIKNKGLLNLILTSLILGGLSFLNTWDVLIYFFIIIMTYGLSRYFQTRHWEWRIFHESILIGGLLILGAILLYLPFYFSFSSQAGPPFLLPSLMRPTRFIHYGVIFGMPLSAIVIWLFTLFQRHRKHINLKVAVFPFILISFIFLIMFILGIVLGISPDGRAQLTLTGTDLGLTLPEYSEFNSLRWSISAVVLLIPAIISSRLFSWFIWFLILMLGVIPLLWTGQRLSKDNSKGDFSVTPFVLIVVFTGVLLSFGPEFVFLKDLFGTRLNTVFKFYYQTWIFFGVAALYALDNLWYTARVQAIIASSIYTSLFFAALLFPIFAIASRANEYSLPSTLNGLAHYEQSPDELDALLWLRDNIEGTPIILEAVGGSYSPQGHGRVSASTGLPTIIGWPFHELQWRGNNDGWSEREENVSRIYKSNWNETQELLNLYSIELIYVGPLERISYGENVEQKFDSNLQIAYENNSVKIYYWVPSDID